jgi:hypothetical protein
MMAHGKASQRRRRRARDQKWRDRQQVVRTFFEQKMAERLTARLVVVGVRPPGREDDGGPVR